MDKKQIALDMHAKWRGKIETGMRAQADDADALAVCYTPGVAEPCLAINRDKSLANIYTRKWNTVAVVTDGTAVLGLGDIGPEAALPVMEGKAVLFKRFGDVDAVPVCLNTKDVSEIVRTVELMAPGLGGVNLEDISAPRCFEIERQLKEKLDIPVFHDDQHGTAIVTLAALINACRLLGRDIGAQRMVISGAGAAGIAIAKLLIRYGVMDIILCDSRGIIGPDGNEAKAEMAAITNPRGVKGSLADAMKDTDVFIGVSAPGIVTGDMVRAMRADPIVFAMANPVPEIMPDEAKAAGACVVGTGRSDFPNQINNVLAFPGVFRGAFDSGAKAITEDMKVAAAEGIAGVLTDGELNADCVMPGAFDLRVGKAVAAAVMKVANGEK